MEISKEEIEDKRKKKWIDVWFAIEALAVREDVLKEAMKTHIEKISKQKNVIVYETKYHDIKKVQNPLKNVKEAYSQYVEVSLLVKDVHTLMTLIINYGPSSVEVKSPESKEMKINEIQSLANYLATLIHQFASAGVGGIVMTPK